MRRVKQFLALAGLTAMEAMRQPICLLLCTACIVLTALVPFLLLHNFGEDGKLARDSGLACHFVFGVFLAGYAASSSLAREMRCGTASAVLSKPVDRAVFFLAKFAGIAGLMLMFAACATLATLLSERAVERFYAAGLGAGYVTDWQTGRMLLASPFVALLAAALLNYAARRPFESTAFVLQLFSLLLVLAVCSFFDRMGRIAPLDFRVDWRIVPASVLVAMALTVLAALALSLSTRLKAVPTLSFCAVVFVAGLMSDAWVGRIPGSRLAAVVCGLLPNWQHFWRADALTGGGTIPWPYIGSAGVYALVYSAAILCLGFLSFRHAEMK